MTGLLITLDIDEASDNWGFVGVIKVGEMEAYRTLEAFPTPLEALQHTQQLVAGVFGEMLAGQEWRHVRDSAPHGHAPTRKDFRLGSLFGSAAERAVVLDGQRTPDSDQGATAM